jgi:hypothetical protein
MLFIFLGLRLTGTAGIGTAWRREDFNMRSEQNWRPLSRNQVSKALELLLRIGGVRGLGEIFRAPKTAASRSSPCTGDLFGIRIFAKSGGFASYGL